MRAVDDPQPSGKRELVPRGPVTVRVPWLRSLSVWGAEGDAADRIRNHNSNMWSGCYWWHIVATAISSFFSFLRNEGAAAREVRASTREVSSVNPTGTLFHPNRVYLGDLTAVDREKSWSSVEMGPVMLQLLLI